MSRPRLIALLLALATLVVYLPVAQDGFLSYDDDDYVTGNPFVVNGLTLTDIKWAFTTFHASNWHPVTWLSHMTDCQLFNLNAGAHHFVNALLHSANTALLFLLLWRLTQKIWPAALVAALFAWHPLHVESVAWVAERKDVLSTCFALLSLLNYAGYAQSKVESRKPGLDKAAAARRPAFDYSLALLFFALGLMAKPMLVTLPFVLLLLLDFWPLRRFSPGSFRWPLVFEKTPFFLLAAASCVVTCFAQHSAISTLDDVSLSPRLENAAVSLVRYLLAIFWPANLAIIYPYARIPASLALPAVVALVLVSAAVWQLRRRSPFYLFGWLWFLGTLVPVIGLVQVGATAMADRYSYIPSVGIFIAAAYGLQELAEKRPGSKKMLLAGMILLLTGCVALTERQLGYWRDGETLFRHTIAVTKNNDTAHINLALALDKKGQYAEAIDEYREALRINPFHKEAHFPIGNILEKLGRPAEALDEYEICLPVKPKNAALHNDIGRTLAALGKPEDALAELAKAAQLDPNYATPDLEAAKILFRQGRDAEAVAQLHAATQAEPYSLPILSSAAHYLAANQDDAVRDGQAALVLALKANDLSGGNDPEVLDVLGMALAETGDFTNAQACAQGALNLLDATNLTDAGLIRERIADYQNRQPWRESFGATNQP